MATKIIYDKGFDPVHITGKHDKKIKKIICKNIPPDWAFINTTWLEIDRDLKNIFNRNVKEVICYSSVDWENTICRKEQHDYIKKNTDSITHIGNANNEYYFSFWMDFVWQNYNQFMKFDTLDLGKDFKVFMCLNRKPHTHRVDLVKEIYDKGLEKNGYVSLGMFDKPVPWSYKGLKVPIKLKDDIQNTVGDNAVAGSSGGITNDITGLGHKDNWNNHFLNVVTETTVHSDVFISEKTFKPILGMRPFVILGDDNIYNKLHSWGFDTFDDILGTGYKGTYHTDRIKWIVDTIDNLKREKDLKKLLKSLHPRLEKNKVRFFQVAEQNRKKIQNLFL